MNELALFAGAGGGILGGKLLGWRTVCAVEWEPYAACLLAQRQNDGLLPPFPIWDDVRTFDGRSWRGIVDVVSGGFPCQDISVAGKGAGIEGKRSGMWVEMARIIGEVRPRWVFVENTPALTSRGLNRVLGDLATLGFDARWGVLGAAQVGANHQRDRIWIVGDSTRELWRTRRGRPATAGERESQPERQIQSTNANSLGRNQTGEQGYDKPVSDQHGDRATKECRRHELELRPSGHSNQSAYTRSERLEKRNGLGCSEAKREWPLSAIATPEWWAVEPSLDRVAHGVAARVDRIRAAGNGQVPLCAADAWRLLTR